MATDQTYDTVSIEAPVDGVARLTLSRPEAGNALSTQLARDIRAALTALRFSEAKVIVLTGAGRHFCVGADLKERDRPPSWLWELRDAIDLIEQLPQPVIVAINGSCMGGGTELALAGDFRLIGRSVAIGFPEVQFGALPAAGGPQRLLRLVGPARAKLLIMRGTPIDATAALDIGLVEEVVEDDRLLDRATEFATELAARPGYGLAATKFLINHGADMPLADGLAMDYAIMERMATPEERAAEVAKARERGGAYTRIFGSPDD